MITFELNNAIYMIYQEFGVYTGAFVIDNMLHRLEQHYTLCTEVHNELIKLHNKIYARQSEQLLESN